MHPLLLTACTQKLTLMEEGGLHRTVNGELLYTGFLPRKKYQTVCEGEGKASPGLERLQRGDVVRIHSIQRLWQKGSDEKITLSRPVVEGSLVVLDEKGKALAFDQVGDFVIPNYLGAPFYVGYCPILTVRLTQVVLSSARGGLNQVWSFTGEEV